MEFKLFKKINHLRFFLWVTIHLIFYFCFLIVTRAPTLCWGFLQYFLALGYKINSKAHYCFFLKNKTRTKKDYLYIMIISDCCLFVFFLSASLLAKVIESKPTEVLDSVKMFTLFLALQQCSAFIL